MAGKLIGTGSYTPEDIVTNDDLSNIIETNDEWISSRTGIKERRLISGDDSTANMASTAAKRAIKNAGIAAEDIDLIIVATMSADNIMPNAACEVQKAIGAVNAACFDINAACTGFVFAINTANAYLCAGFCKTALVIGADVVSKLLDWSDRATCVLFGDGAGAVILREDAGGYLKAIMRSDGSRGEVLTCPGREISNPMRKHITDNLFVKMNGQEVFKFAVTKVTESINELLEQENIDIGDIRYFVLHQANKRIIEAVARRLNIPDEYFPMNISKYGNTSAASIPILLDEMNKAGTIARDDMLIISGFGAGLTWGSLLIKW